LALGIVFGGAMPTGGDACAWCASLSGREGGGGSVSRRCQGACVLVAAGREGSYRGSGEHAVALSGQRRSNAHKTALLGWEGGSRHAAVLAGQRWGVGRAPVAGRDDGGNGVPLRFWGGGVIAGHRPHRPSRCRHHHRLCRPSHRRHYCCRRHRRTFIIVVDVVVRRAITIIVDFVARRVVAIAIVVINVVARRVIAPQ